MIKQQEVIDLYQAIYELTQPECKNSCRAPLSCCSPEYCQLAKEWAQTEYGIVLEPTGEHPTLPFMSKNGCTVAPYLRPICTVHTCDINSLGVFRNDSDGVKTNRYFELRDKIEEQIYASDDMFLDLQLKESGARQ